MSNPTSKKVAVFGGTFDPVHLGHLILAEQAREQADLDQVWFVPAATPPHKQDQKITPFEQRVEMLRLAVAGQPSFHIDELEKGRPGPSYTVDTLAEFRRRHPATEFSLLIGSDCLPDLPHWHDPEGIIELARLLVVPRPGWPMGSAEELRTALRLPRESILNYRPVDVPLVEISSRELRRRVSQGKSVRFLVPRSVECYIHDKRLYHSTEQ